VLHKSEKCITRNRPRYKEKSRFLNFARVRRVRNGAPASERNSLWKLRRPRRLFALAGLERVRLPAIVYAAVQGPRAGVKAISARAFGGAGRHLDPALVYALLSEPLGVGRLRRDRREKRQGRDQHCERSISRLHCV
jgi:hypothetical protein